MLNSIIKRDGTTEIFTPSKLNHWAEWAAKDLGDRIDWSTIALHAVKELSGSVHSQDLQKKLIEKCLESKTWPYILMAGKLYAVIYRKELYESLPSVVSQFNNLADLGIMRQLSYSATEWSWIDSIIKHDRDFSLAHFQLEQIRFKYALTNRVTKEEYETPQFVYMRMATALAENEPTNTKLRDVEAYYDHFSLNQINPPTPNYANLGTLSNGFASCCLYKADDNARSLAIGDHISYTMTYMSAGIGGLINTRTAGDPIRGGAVRHNGKYNYFKSVAGQVKANLQGSRGGACTEYFSAYDPEVLTMLMYQNPKTVTKKQNRDIHFSILFNRFIGLKAALNEDVFVFTCYSAPDLFEAMFSGDISRFEELYHKYERDDSFKKEYISARRILTTAGQQSEEVATMYYAQIDEMNRHTSFKEPIHTSNLCSEITSPTEAYEKITDLYIAGYVGETTFIDQHNHTQTRSNISPIFISHDGEQAYTRYRATKQGIGGHRGQIYDLKEGDAIVGYDNELYVSVIEPLVIKKIISRTKQPEVGLCSIAGIVVSNIATDAEYESACYYALKMIDKCIHMSHYELPHIGFTAKQRLNAGVGIVGLAHHLAKLGLDYTSTEGLAEIHRVAERHCYFVIKASLKLGKELGNAPWIHRTKWVDGWLPIDTYKPTVDDITPPIYHYDWEQLRTDIIKNKGIRNSSLIAHMPTESSSKASGVPNGLYPIRDTIMKKLDGSNRIDWYAPDGDILSYQIAWDLSFEQMVKVYAIVQKFTDQSISADYYRNRVKNPILTNEELLNEFLLMIKYGVKTKYYQNPYTVEVAGIEDQSVNTKIECAGGGCQL